MTDVVTTATRPGPGPRPGGPTHPKPSAPPKPTRSDHLPRLGEVIRDAERLGAQMIATLGRQWDPTSGPAEGDGPWEANPGTADRYLGNAVANVRAALDELALLAALDLPPAGSAVKIAARQDRPVSAPGGPSQPPDDTGEGAARPAMPAALAGPACESDGVAPPSQATSSPGDVPGEGLRPGLAVAASPGSDGGSLGGFATPGAGGSSCLCLMCAPRISSWADFIDQRRTRLTT